MTKTELDARRFNLMRRISEIEDELILDTIELCLQETDKVVRNYPYAPSSKEELHAIIEQVLEDDRNGKFMDIEESKRLMREKITARYREEEIRKCGN